MPTRAGIDTFKFLLLFVFIVQKMIIFDNAPSCLPGLDRSSFLSQLPLFEKLFVVVVHLVLAPLSLRCGIDKETATGAAFPFFL